MLRAFFDSSHHQLCELTDRGFFAPVILDRFGPHSIPIHQRISSLASRNRGFDSHRPLHKSYPLSMHFVQGVLKTGNDSNYRAVPKHRSRGIIPVHAGWIPLGFWVTLVTLNCAELYRVELSSGDLSVLPTVALNFENLVAKVLPITISSAAMVKEKGRLIGIGIFELDEHFSTLDNPAALCALLYFRHCFLTYRGLERAFAMLMGDTQASRDRRILVLR
jgi:hypothetical protein